MDYWPERRFDSGVSVLLYGNNKKIYKLRHFFQKNLAILWKKGV